MGKVDVKLSSKGFRELLNSPGVIKDLKARAEKIAAAAGPGMETTEAKAGPNRADVEVYTATYAAKRAEAENRTLTRAIDAGR